jgi:IS5 family transposase
MNFGYDKCTNISEDPSKSVHLMIRYRSQKQLTLTGFSSPFRTKLDPENRWVKLADLIPWDDLARAYHKSLLSSSQGRPAKDARMVIGAVIIKHKLCLSDEETVQQIQENPYLQFFVGLSRYQTEPPFAPSLFVEIRKRMGQTVFEGFHEAIIGAIAKKKPAKKNGNRPPQPPTPGDSSSGSNGTKAERTLSQAAASTPAKAEQTNRGKLILDATVADQAIRYPTDLSLLNEARQFSEQIIDRLYPHTAWPGKPRTYRQKARQAFLAVVKQHRPSRTIIRRGIKQQLQYLRRNLGHIEALMATWPVGTSIPLPHWLMRRYWVIQHLHDQQWTMYCSNSRRCENRIVSISQPHVRPIVRGKQHKAVEFGAKLSVSLTGEGIARVDHLRWDAFHEGHDLESQVEAYHRRYGYYPEVVLGDPSYGSRDNRKFLKKHAIRFAGKPLGRPPAVTGENREQLEKLKAQRRQEYLQRIPIEGKFGQGKNGYRLNYIRAKLASTSSAWINSIFLVMNLLILLRILVFAFEIARSWFEKRLEAAPDVAKEGYLAIRKLFSIRTPGIILGVS